MRILLLNGPNLNLLGDRAPEIYGTETLADVERMCEQWANDLSHELAAFQSNHEGELVDAIQDARGNFDGIVLNGGAFTHYSYAIHDALESVGIPTVEIHISNIRDREEWRRHSVTEPATVYQIFGRGIEGYRAAIRRLHHLAVSPPIVVSYGDHEDQVGDLRVPAGDAPHPVMVLLHGGFWREEYTRDSLDSVAIDLVSRGFATFNAEYRRIPPVGDWRTVIGDATAAIDSVADLAKDHPLDPDHVSVLGHSAGAHLAVLAAKGAVTVPKLVVLLGGVLDFSVMESDHEALFALLGEDLSTHRGQIDPTALVPLKTSSLVAHGDLDDVVDPVQAANFVAAAQAAGDDSQLLTLPDADHYDIVDAASSAWQEIASHLL